jgi:competence protein ComEA
VEPTGAPWRALESTEAEGSPSEPAARGIPWLAMGAVAVAIAVCAVALLLANRPEPTIEVDGAGGSVEASAADATDRAAAEAGVVVVEVGGAVTDPGVYRLPAGSRVGDAVTAAGGFGPRVDVGLADRQLNLAAPLHDGDEIHVPVRGELAASAGGAGDSPAGAAASGPIDLNRATADQLDTLPGIGPVTVAKIVAAREEQPFASIDDLGTRKVVGAATLEKIRALVIVGP